MLYFKFTQGSHAVIFCPAVFVLPVSSHVVISRAFQRPPFEGEGQQHHIIRPPHPTQQSAPSENQATKSNQTHSQKLSDASPPLLPSSHFDVSQVSCFPPWCFFKSCPHSVFFFFFCHSDRAVQYILRVVLIFTYRKLQLWIIRLGQSYMYAFFDTFYCGKKWFEPPAC